MQNTSFKYNLLLKILLLLNILALTVTRRFSFNRFRRVLTKQSLTMTSTSTSNVLLQDWSKNEFGLPPFESIQASDFEPALKLGMSQQLEDLAAIVSNPEEPTFENTIEKFDLSGETLKKVAYTFHNLCSSNGYPELQAVEMKMAGPLAAHFNQVYTYPGLFQRLDKVHQNLDSAKLDAEQRRLVERFHLDFVRAGARFDDLAKAEYAKITEKLAELTTQFTQNVLADESDIFITLDKQEDLAGLPKDLIDAARQAAIERKVEGDNTHVITLSRSLVEPFITFSERRDLREKAWRLWTNRGELDPKRDNLDIAAQILTLRTKQAEMHGYKSFAEYATADTMAGSPARVMELMEEVWTKGKVCVDRERGMLEQYMKSLETGVTASSNNMNIEPWDWRYYAEKVRMMSFNLDEAEVKPFFSLNRMVEAIFDCAYQLFGLKFKLREDLKSYHPDVQTYEVWEEDKKTGNEKFVAVFLHDNYARPYKHSGAWMSEYRSQYYKDGERVIPIIVNNNNFNKAKEGEQVLLSFDDAVTLFHEFGHGLHGMLSDVRSQRLAGTSVLKDFVELPSQLYEHWLSEPKVLKKHARHYKTNEPISDELLEKLKRANLFNKGFETIEFMASALVDMAIHQYKPTLGSEENPEVSALETVKEEKRVNGWKGSDVADFERDELKRLGMPAGIVMRHRPAHFQHLFSGSSYAAGYYVYLWASVLDADGFEAFKEAGDCFDPEVAKRVKEFVYSSGNSRDPAEAYRLFRGRDPAVEPMLKQKGLLVQN